MASGAWVVMRARCENPKTDRFERYRCHDRRVYGQRDERALRRTLDDERHRALIGPDGEWRRHVDVFLAERDGDTEKAAR